MWKLLILLAFLLNLQAFADEESLQSVVNQKIANASNNLEKKESFAQKITLIKDLKKDFSDLDRDYPAAKAKKNLKDYHFLSQVLTALETIELDDFSQEKCDQNLNSIVVSFSPQKTENPVLPLSVKVIYNLVATACDKEIMK